MGYHVTILRTQGQNSIPITLADAVAQLSEEQNWAYDENQNAFIYLEGEHQLTLWHENNELWTSNPSKWALSKMIKVATALDARVRGDELETYESADNSFSHPDDKSLIDDIRKKCSSKRRSLPVTYILFMLSIFLAVFIAKYFE